jgi:hypothetical protein
MPPLSPSPSASAAEKDLTQRARQEEDEKKVTSTRHG